MANDELIARLEAAEGPQFVLDVEIWKTCQPADWKWQHGRFNPPAFTASIDAALTLVPSGKGHDPWWMLKAPWRGKAKAEIWVDGKGKPFRGEAPTPALAICIAALKARSHD